MFEYLYDHPTGDKEFVGRGWGTQQIPRPLDLVAHHRDKHNLIQTLLMSSLKSDLKSGLMSVLKNDLMSDLQNELMGDLKSDLVSDLKNDLVSDFMSDSQNDLVMI